MTEVVLSIAPNPKRANSGAAIRYELYYVGGTEEDLLARGLNKQDLSWDRKQEFVEWGPGERVEPPPKPDLAPLPAPATRTTTRAVSPASPEASGASDGPRALAVGVTLPAASVEVNTDGTAPDKPAPYWRGTVRVAAEASAGTQGRDWTVRVTLPDGRVLRRTVPSDRLAGAIITAATLHGVDADDWTEEKTS